MLMPDLLIGDGEVWLVGAGPGDPDLLTRKAERLLQAATIVFFDALVGPDVLALIPSCTERVAVGKRSGRHSKDQKTINDLLLGAALAGERVVRLKGGDPGIFGRAAEEIAHLQAHGVSVNICPGITAASAASASAGISTTLRGMAQSLIFVTAHARAGARLDLDWALLGMSNATLAVYMGRAAAQEIAQNLIAGGRRPDTPVIVAVNVSLFSERLIRGTLTSLPFLVRTISDDDPTLLLIGDAVGNQGSTSDILSNAQKRHSASDSIQA
jgi:uroporphyrin-III C-methyltransferase